ncbi:hypothetical protein D3C77_253710 [compost metagenome]
MYAAPSVAGCGMVAIWFGMGYWCWFLIRMRGLFLENLNLDVYERPLRNARINFVIWCCLATITPIAAIAICYWCGTPSSWISRSGAVMAGFAFLATLGAQGMSDVFIPNGYAGQTFGDLPQRYGSQIKWFKKISVTLVLIGTAVWGFGDLIPIEAVS